MKVATGVPRLDDLLDGGVPSGSSVLVYGPPFAGKKVLARNFLLAGVRGGEPGVLVLTSAATSDVRVALAEVDAEYPKHEGAGLVAFVDAYSKAIGAEDDFPHAEYVDGPLNLNGVAVAVNNAERRVLPKHPTHRLVVDSVSTLIAYTNAQTTFRFLQVLMGKAKRAGATIMLVLEQGMHSEAEVQMFKHLADGMIELKREQNKTLLQVMGAGVTEERGWVEYRHTPRSFDVTGSFAAGRIR